jgi:hypothetical protein
MAREKERQKTQRRAAQRKGLMKSDGPTRRARDRPWIPQVAGGGRDPKHGLNSLDGRSFRTGLDTMQLVNSGQTADQRQPTLIMP